MTEESNSAEPKEGTKETDEFSWNAFSINMAQLPPISSKVLYFPQGHIENFGNLDMTNCPRIPSYISCRVSEKKFTFDPDTDELFQILTLMPLSGNEPDLDTDQVLDVPDTRLIFSKTLSQSDVENSEECSVSKHCAETLFPPLDYHHQTPGQTVEAMDVQRNVWKFSHVYRGGLKGHLLTKGWSQFTSAKKLVAGNSIMLFKTITDLICVWIKRSEKVDWSGKVEGRDVIDALNRAARGEAFHVVLCSGDSAPACVVLESLVKPALQIRWYPGMRVKSASSDIRPFTGTVLSMYAADPVRWPASPWGILQVQWDELQNVTRVNPWLVEPLSPTSDSYPIIPPPFKQVINGQVRYLVGPSQMFTLACIEAERRGDKIRKPSEGSSSGVNQPKADEQSPGEGSSDK